MGIKLRLGITHLVEQPHFKFGNVREPKSVGLYMRASVVEMYALTPGCRANGGVVLFW